MAEIAQEDGSGPAKYQAAIHNEIINTSYHLHVSLLLLDTLMENFNSSK